jgi:hypothetical protein
MKRKILLPEPPPQVTPDKGGRNLPGAPIHVNNETASVPYVAQTPLMTAQPPTVPTVHAVSKGPKNEGAEITSADSNKYAPPSSNTSVTQNLSAPQNLPAGLNNKEQPNNQEAPQREAPKITNQEKSHNSRGDVKRSSDQGGMWFFLTFICACVGLFFYFYLRASMASKSHLNTTVYGTPKQQVDSKIYPYRQEDSLPQGSSSPQNSSAGAAPLVPNDNNNQTAPLIEKTPPAQQPLLKQNPSKPKAQKKPSTTRPSSPEKLVKKDGIEELLRMAEAGDLQAQSQLAHQYSTGKGTKVNHEEAFRWNLLAAKRGSSRAQSNLGVAYANGYAVDADIIEGYAWWYIASRSGSAHARSNMLKYENILTDKQKAQAIARAKVLSKKVGN